MSRVRFLAGPLKVQTSTLVGGEELDAPMATCPFERCGSFHTQQLGTNYDLVTVG